MKVTLTIHGKEHDGKKFEFTEPGSFLFGSSKFAQCRITGDPYVSRNHCYLIIDPSEVRLRDLQSTNGTEVDGVLYKGGKSEDEDLEMNTFVKDDDPLLDEDVLLRHGSDIEVGYTKITVAIEENAQCLVCNGTIPHDEEKQAITGKGIICSSCQMKQEKEESETEGQEAEKHKKVERLIHEGEHLLAQGKQREAAVVFRNARRLDPKNPAILNGLRRAQARPPGEIASPIGENLSDQMMRFILGNLRMEKPKGAIPDIPNYELLGEISRGGMGAVFEGLKLDTNEQVAIKIIIPDRPVSDHALSRFRREILITQAMGHPNIVKAFDGDIVNKHLWVALEFVERGWDIGKEMQHRRGPVPVTQALQWVLQALGGLAYAHNYEGRIIHRDIKPSNILLARKGSGYKAMLADFGLAKCLEESALNASIITKPGLIMGTLPYMPPEQVIDMRSVKPPGDVFSMGATLYQMLTTKFVRDFKRNQNVMIRQVVQDPVVPIEKRDPSIPKPLAIVINKSLSLEPAKRYPDGAAMKAALEALTL